MFDRTKIKELPHFFISSWTRDFISSTVKDVKVEKVAIMAETILSLTNNYCRFFRLLLDSVWQNAEDRFDNNCSIFLSDN